MLFQFFIFFITFYYFPTIVNVDFKNKTSMKCKRKIDYGNTSIFLHPWSCMRGTLILFKNFFTGILYILFVVCGLIMMSMFYFIWPVSVIRFCNEIMCSVNIFLSDNFLILCFKVSITSLIALSIFCLRSPYVFTQFYFE